MINVSKLDQKLKIRSMNETFFHRLTDQKPEKQNKSYIDMSKFYVGSVGWLVVEILSKLSQCSVKVEVQTKF